MFVGAASTEMCCRCIGYGHVAPKTVWGRVVTILYAIVGIPLTLLTITNLGGFMATAFRFVYRNVCCICCRSRPDNRRETGNGNHPDTDVGPEVTWCSSIRQILTDTDDIRSVQVSAASLPKKIISNYSFFSLFDKAATLIPSKYIDRFLSLDF